MEKYYSDPKSKWAYLAIKLLGRVDPKAHRVVRSLMETKLDLHHPPALAAEAYPSIAHDLVPWTTNKGGFAGGVIG